jgi:CRISPR-associated Csx2 family protein
MLMSTPLTLITFLGGHQSKPKPPGAYVKTRYQFSEETIVSAGYFGEALLRSGLYRIEQVLILGSRTSAWELLVQESDPDLALEALEQTEGGGITPELLRQLERQCGAHWSCTVVLYAGEAGVSEEIALQELMRYESRLAQIPESHEVLLDFTHGFRSMPILLLSALRFRAALTGQQNLKSIRLVYGELREGSSPVHVLDGIWTGLKVAEGARLFFEKFEGEELAQEVEEFWPKGAKALRQFSQTVQDYVFYKVEDALRALRNALAEVPAEAPEWFAPVRHKLELLLKELLQPRPGQTLLALSRELFRLHLHGPAFLVLDEALVACVIEAKGLVEAPIFEELKRARDELLLGRQELKRIEYARNQFAHGRRKIQRRNESPLREFHELCKSLEPYTQDPSLLLDAPEEAFR